MNVGMIEPTGEFAPFAHAPRSDSSVPEVALSDEDLRRMLLDWDRVAAFPAELVDAVDVPRYPRFSDYRLRRRNAAAMAMLSRSARSVARRSPPPYRFLPQRLPCEANDEHSIIEDTAMPQLAP